MSRLPRCTGLLLILLSIAACDGLRLPGRKAAADSLPPVEPPNAGKRNRPAKPAVSRDPGQDPGRLAQIRRGLRRLVVAEEGFFAENGAYTEDLARLGFAPEGDTEVRFLWLSRAGWAASGTHPGVPGRDCVIFVGRSHGPPTTLRDVRSGKEGVPVCDAASAPRPAATAMTAPAVPEAAGPDTASALEAVTPQVQMRVDLRNLVRSQDSYLAQQGVYARRTEPFALQYLWHRGVTITILTADRNSWSARAVHVSRPGKSCVIWSGPVLERPATAVDKRTPDQPGIPVCDD
jgi:hypothetical protein